MRRLKWTIAVFIIGVLGKPPLAAANPGDIYVELMGARISFVDHEFVGHAFACIEFHLNSGIKDECFGFYPHGDKVRIGGPSGIINSEWKTNPGRFSRVEQSIKIKITDTLVRSIYQSYNDFNSKDYRLTSNNCIDFVHQIASVVGLKRPSRSAVQTPAGYIAELKRLNS